MGLTPKRPGTSRSSEAGLDRRPFWLLRRPMPISDASVRILAGPERIESGWWDEHDKRRDYYVIETHLGQRAWAFVPVAESTGWTLHGWFA
jgi:protein ImuB